MMPTSDGSSRPASRTGEHCMITTSMDLSEIPDAAAKFGLWSVPTRIRYLAIRIPYGARGWFTFEIELESNHYG